MRSFVSFRLAAQLCLTAAVLCVFSPFKADWPAFALLALLALLAGLGAGGCADAKRRLLWGLLPLLAVALPVSGWLVRGALLVPALYAAVFLAFGRFSLAPWQYRREALVLILLAGVLLIVSGLGTVQSTPSRVFAGAAVLLALLALRAMQLGPFPTAAWQAGSAGLFFLPLAGGALAGTVLWLSVPLLQYPARAIATLMGGLLSLWSRFWGWVMGYAELGEDFNAEPTEVFATLWTMDGPRDDRIESNGRFRLLEEEIPWSAILIFLGAVALILLVIWLLRRGAPAEKRERREDLKSPEALEAEHRARRFRRTRRTAMSGRERLRAIYREYLLFLQSNGIVPGSSATTAEISEEAAAVLVESDEILRGLYRKARYSGEAITEEEIRAASEAYARLLRAEKLRKLNGFPAKDPAQMSGEEAALSGEQDHEKD